MIKNKKVTSKLISVLSAVLAIAMLSTTVFASGVLSGLTEDNYTIEILINGTKIEFTNKPFIENGDVYIPLREVIDKISIINNEKNDIVWDNGKIEIYTEEYAFESGENISIIDGHGIEIGINKLGDIGKYNTIYIDMPNAPILKNSQTYIPYTYLEYIMHGRYKKIQLNYIVYDKEGNTISTRAPESVIDQFFANIEAENYENAKGFCVDDIKDDISFSFKPQKLNSSIVLDYTIDSFGQISAECYSEVIDEELSADSYQFVHWKIYLVQQPDHTYLINGWETIN